MNKGVKDYTLLERTISTLMGVRELRVSPGRDSQAASRPLKAPLLEHFDFGKKGVKQPSPKAAPRKKQGKVKPYGPPRPVERNDTANPSLGRKVARLFAFVSVIAVSIVVNELYGYPVRGSRWLKAETYRTIIKNVLESEELTAGDGTQRTINITGIAYSSDKPSVMIGDKIAHVGDVVSDATIMRIGPKEVVFRDGDHTWTEKVH